MTKLEWGLLIWLGLWGGAFLALELPAHFGLTPWPTLSSTDWTAEADWEPVRLLGIVFLAVLAAHLAFKLNVFALISVAIVGALAILIHVLTN